MNWLSRHLLLEDRVRSLQADIIGLRASSWDLHSSQEVKARGQRINNYVEGESEINIEADIFINTAEDDFKVQSEPSRRKREAGQDRTGRDYLSENGCNCVGLPGLPGPPGPVGPGLKGRSFTLDIINYFGFVYLIV